jgi:hypothetical protein
MRVLVEQTRDNIQTWLERLEAYHRDFQLSKKTVAPS